MKWPVFSQSKNRTHTSANLTTKKRRRQMFAEPLEPRWMLAANIHGGVYNDLNGDGILAQTEGGLAVWTVFLDQNHNGDLDSGEASTTTNADGDYSFPGLAAGNYRVAEIVRSGWNATNPVSGYMDVNLTNGSEVRVDFLNEGGGGTGIITGNVWRDVNNDGVKDPEDTPLAGWTVFIDYSQDNVLDLDEPFELTDADGNYWFTGVLGGAGSSPLDYEVSTVVPTGWEPRDENHTAAVLEGQITEMPDFILWPDPEQLSGVNGRVYEDGNGNGIQDVGESGIGGWTVFADLNLNSLADSGEPFGTTSSNGNYSIFGVETGNVRIAQLSAPSHRPTNPITGYQNVYVTFGSSVSGVNFGNQLRTDGAIGGTVFVDRNHNLTRDEGEEGIAGIQVFLDLDNDGEMDVGEPSMVTGIDLFYTPDVNEAGNYRFEDLALGTYIVRHSVPPELSATPASELAKVVSLGPGDDAMVNLADRYRPSEIHGFNFADLNGNGSYDAGEPGVPGVTMYLDLNRNNVLDLGEPSTLTLSDGTYEFHELEASSYLVREIVPPGWMQTFPDTHEGILWPEGVSNPAVGNVTPSLIQVSLEQGETHTHTVSLTLPGTGSLTNKVDVFLLFDDTGSFTANSPIVRAAFPEIIDELQTRLTGVDLGFGVGRLEEYGSFASEYASGRPFILNQPIISSSPDGYTDAQVLASIQAALDRVAPGYGGDRPETVIEALYQMVTGAGFDGNNNGLLLDSGPAGLAMTQVAPGSSGDVPPFASFVSDPANGVLAPSGAIGGAGFRSGALPIIITATDTGFAYQANGGTTITGLNGLAIPAAAITLNGRGTTPFGSGAQIQDTVTGLNALGALVIGLGVNDAPTQDPRIGLEALASLTGAINRTTLSIANGTVDAIAPGDPLYFKIGTGGDPLVLNIADGIVAAIEGAVTSVNVNVTLRASDPRVHIDFALDVIHGLGAGDTATFDVTFTGDGRPHRFDLQFIREGTDVVLGSIPVVLGTPVEGDGYEYEDCHEGEHTYEVNFGNQFIGTTNQAPIANDDLFNSDQDAPLSVVDPGVLSNDLDPDGDLMSVNLMSTTQHGALVLHSNGAFQYLPNSGYVGLDSFTYQVSDGTEFSDIATVQIHVNAIVAPTTKFLVLDRSRLSIFEYESNGSYIEDDWLDPQDGSASDIAMSPDGSVRWVVDDRGEVFVYDAEVHRIGNWKFAGVDKPQGITVSGDDLWLVSDGTNRIAYFADGALRRTGNTKPTQLFDLNPSNGHPRGIATDGTTLWVVDDGGTVDQVFAYSVSGGLVGSWNVDPTNTSPTGIAIDPENVDILWIVDALSNSVYQYKDVLTQTGSSLVATSSFSLHATNLNPQGIAAPTPQILPSESQAKFAKSVPWERLFRQKKDTVPEPSSNLALDDRLRTDRVFLDESRKCENRADGRMLTSETLSTSAPRKSVNRSMTAANEFSLVDHALSELLKEDDITFLRAAFPNLT